jgi:hypothetical protein
VSNSGYSKRTYPYLKFFALLIPFLIFNATFSTLWNVFLAISVDVLAESQTNLPENEFGAVKVMENWHVHQLILDN